ncbi:MAG: translational GTPase TypA [Aerococcus sp.]|nr:translational GTPase TypA [Aerococcus sp.]
MPTHDNIRNVAIIAHVDHGKTTLVNQLLEESDTLGDREQIMERAMDSNDIERERGITILAKNTAVNYKGTRINILDTPGHADFGGEVERIMNMVDGVVLVVDAAEGTMPQTRFVLQKAFEAGKVPVVVVNKIDKPAARPLEVVDEVLDLFIELGANEDQIEFPVVYASALAGTSSYSPDPDKQEKTMDPIFDTILNTVPAPSRDVEAPLQFQVYLLDYNDYVGRIGIGRVIRGKIKVGDTVTVNKLDGSTKNFRVTKLYGFLGLNRIEINEAEAGDIIAISGMEDIFVGETVTDTEHLDALPPLHIDEPTLQMTFLTNDSPFAGQDGDKVTARKLEDRLKYELHTDVSLRVDDTEDPDRWIVSGRGELHLSVLIENLRREGFELQVSRPKVITKEIDGVLCEPFESVQIDTPDEYSGTVIQSLNERHGQMLNMENTGRGTTRLEYDVPARGMIGYNSEFITATHGYGILNHTFKDYRPMIKEEIGRRRNGSLVSTETGKTTTYGIMQVEDRGTIFVEPGTEVYEGMVVGQNSREADIDVNIVKSKNLTNVRSATKDQTATIKTPKIMNLEQSLEFMDEDEYCEITPEHIRIRKQILNKSLRLKEAKKHNKK